MKKLFLIFTIAFAALPALSYSQFSRYIIQLKDKTGTPHTLNNPATYLSKHAIERRTRYNIAIELTDLPITPRYLDSIRLSGNVAILNVSKWLNQVCIQTTDAVALSKINNFSFVKSALPIAARGISFITPVNKQLDGPASSQSPAPVFRPQSPQDVYSYGLAYAQVHLNNTEFLHNHGFRGEGMKLAVMDAGFFNYQTLPTFDSVRLNGQIAETWDFVANEASVNEDNAHGMGCFSTIAANLPGSFVGTAPKGSFYLYRTEDAGSEYPVEEQNFAAAAERADSIGVDIFSVSLGYNTFDNSSFNYTYPNFDGNTSISARAADLAARKGIIVTVAAGNEGNGSWRYLTTPSDGDSVLSVGAVNAMRQVAGFSSFGPSGDGQIKPDVAAIGQGTVVANQFTGQPSYNNGTSFACPVIAGLATCLWQAFPEVSNMVIIDALRKSADKASAPDNRTGYGIPDAKKAFVSLIKRQFTQQVVINNNCQAVISWSVKSAINMNVSVERKLPSETVYTTINTQNGTGAFALKNLNYTDDLQGVATGIAISYRLKMIIGTDTSFYLDSAMVNYSQGCGGAAVTEKIIIGPNPVSNFLNVAVVRNNSSKLSLVLHTQSGQKIYEFSQQVNGSQTFNIPMKHLASGVYYVTIYLDDKKELVKKIVR